jgi:FkbH-like protein
MKLLEALEIISKRPEPGSEVRKVHLVCGFTPLHLQTFLTAELQLRFPERRVEVSIGQYGDIAGSLERLDHEQLEGVVVVLEWEDLDRRLGTRQLGGWGPGNLTNIQEQTALRLSQLRVLLERASDSAPVVISLPTLPLPPIFSTTTSQTSTWEIGLKEKLISFAEKLSQRPRIRFLSEQKLLESSPMSGRLDVKSDWTSGFPYSISHASAMAALIAQLINYPTPKKGLITDLDNTLWSGIVGEAGASAISWDLDHHTQGHGFYQQLLKTLLEEGVLIGVASKNDPAVIQDVLERKDLILPLGDVFPLEVSWGAKSAAVTRILSTWNVGADSVVFVDDDPLELAAVQAANPSMTCLRFQHQNPQAIYELVTHLRDLFGKERISEEDQIRLASIRQSSTLRELTNDEGFSEVLLEQSEPELHINFNKRLKDPRALELINKTNQFNLNGRRFSDAEWQQYLSDDDTFLVVAAYQDRFGPLGKIAVLAGRQGAEGLLVESWVMSCRAFARRIEHQCLKFLFDTFNVDVIAFDYQRTQKNGPLARFLEDLTVVNGSSRVTISKNNFAASCPRLFHHVREVREE